MNQKIVKRLLYSRKQAASLGHISRGEMAARGIGDRVRSTTKSSSALRAESSAGQSPRIRPP